MTPDEGSGLLAASSSSWGLLLWLLENGLCNCHVNCVSCTECQEQGHV